VGREVSGFGDAVTPAAWFPPADERPPIIADWPPLGKNGDDDDVLMVPP
jgi:hypothetical protein